MRKTLLLALAFVAATTVFAQDNLALNGTASATSGDARAHLAIDGDEGTRWEAPQGDFADSEDVSWTLDLGDSKTFNAIQIKWEGAYSKSFTISVSADDTDYETIVEKTDETLNELLQTYKFDSRTARYIKFRNIARATEWGVSFWEFRVYNLSTEQVLSSIGLTASETTVKLGNSVNLTVTGKDMVGGDMDAGDVTFEVIPEDAGSFDGTVFTPSKAGEAAIVAKSGNLTSNEVKILTYGGEKIDISGNMAAMVTAIGDGTNTKDMGNAFDDNMTSVWELYGETDADETARTYETGFVIDLMALYDITGLSVTFEGACPADYVISFAGNDGQYDDEHAVKDHAGMLTFTDFFTSDAKEVRYIKFLSTKAATQYGIKIYDFTVYGENKQELEDNAAPTGFTATVNDEASRLTSVTLNLEASDDVSSTVIYTISYEEDGEAKTVDVTGASGAAISYVLDGLTPNTTYNLSVAAKDAKGNSTEAITLTAATNSLPDAAPALGYLEENVLPVYSSKYGNAEGFVLPDWGEQTITKEVALAEDDNALLLINMNYRGIEFAVSDVSDMEYLHVDVFSETANTVSVVPIWRNIETSANFAEIPYAIDGLKQGEWNQVNIPMSAFDSDDRNGTYNVYQIKLDNGNGNTFIFDNIYFYKSGVTDTDAPVWESVEANDITATTATIVAKATDDNADGILTYAVKNSAGETIATKYAEQGEEVVFEITGLTPETTYNFTVSVTDAAKNAAEVRNIEFTTLRIVPTIEETATGCDGKGVYVISGKAISAEEINVLMADEDKTAYDLSKLEIPGDITKIEAKNPNAVLVVTEDQAARLTETRNLCTYANYFFPVNTFELTDGYPVYTASFISTGDKGYKYTRTIEAGKYVTTCVPAVTTLPGGISAYSFSSMTDDVYTFNRIENNTINENTPYILYSAEGGTLEVNGTGDLNLGDSKEGTVSCGDLTFHGNYNTFTGDGTQYGLQNSTESVVLKKVDGATIGAFRGYFTIGDNTSDAKSVRFIFNDGTTTGITSVANDSVKAAAKVYSIDGKFINATGTIEGLSKGLYIVGGKKVIVK